MTEERTNDQKTITQDESRRPEPETMPLTEVSQTAADEKAYPHPEGFGLDDRDPSGNAAAEDAGTVRKDVRSEGDSQGVTQVSGEESTAGEEGDVSETAVDPFDGEEKDSGPDKQAVQREEPALCSDDLARQGASSEAEADAVPSCGKTRSASEDRLERPGIAQKLFDVFSYAGLPVLLVMAALLCTQGVIWPREFWYADEVRHADVFMNIVGSGDFLALTLNGVPYPDKPPLYFAFLYWIRHLTGLGLPAVFFLGLALSEGLFITSIWILARLVGYSRKEAFASGLMVLGCFYCIGLMQYCRMDLMFTALILLASGCFFCALRKKTAPLWLTLAFLLVAAATLVKGPLAPVFTLVPGILFVIWLGKPSRLNSRDGLLGFALMLVILLGWVALLVIGGHSDYLQVIFKDQIVGRAYHANAHVLPWWHYAAIIPALFLPWSFLVFFIDWKSFFKKLPSVVKDRQSFNGSAWLWITALTVLIVLSLMSSKLAVYILPMLAVLAVLAGRALLRLTPRRSRYFFFAVGVVLVVCGIVFAAFEFNTVLAAYLPETVQIPPAVLAYGKALGMTSYFGLLIMGGLLAVTGLLLCIVVRRGNPGGSLLFLVFFIILCTTPYQRLIAPRLNAVLSPKAIAASMAEYAGKGYAPAAFRMYPGTLTYYYNESLSDKKEKRTNIPDLNSAKELRQFLSDNERSVVAMPEKAWSKAAGISGAVKITEQWLEGHNVVLARWDNGGAGVPGPVETLGDGKPSASEGQDGEDINVEPSALPDESGKDSRQPEAFPQEGQPEDVPEAGGSMAGNTDRSDAVLPEDGIKDQGKEAEPARSGAEADFGPGSDAEGDVTRTGSDPLPSEAAGSTEKSGPPLPTPADAEEAGLGRASDESLSDAPGNAKNGGTETLEAQPDASSVEAARSAQAGNDRDLRQDDEETDRSQPDAGSDRTMHAGTDGSGLNEEQRSDDSAAGMPETKAADLQGMVDERRDGAPDEEDPEGKAVGSAGTPADGTANASQL
ncbi:MAG: hypothetical protein J5855_02345 [Mailhella sp.]|nr:hypothetical protein [Mailhella sp.]